MIDKVRVYLDTIDIVKNAVTSSAADTTRDEIGTFIQDVYNALKEISKDVSKNE